MDLRSNLNRFLKNGHLSFSFKFPLYIIYHQRKVVAYRKLAAMVELLPWVCGPLYREAFQAVEYVDRLQSMLQAQHFAVFTASANRGQTEACP